MYEFTKLYTTKRMQDKMNLFKSWVQVVWIQFSFSQTGYIAKVKELSMPYNLPIAEGQDSCLSPKALVWSEMQTVLSKTLNLGYQFHFLWWYPFPNSASFTFQVKIW